MPFRYQLSTLLSVCYCTYIPSLSVSSGHLYRLTELTSDLAVISILSSYSPLCVTGVATLTPNRTLIAVLWLSKQESFRREQSKKLILGQETQLAILGMSSCYLYTRGIAHCPYMDAWRVRWVFYSNNRTRHGSRPPMPHCPYQSALESLSYMRPTNQN